MKALWRFCIGILILCTAPLANQAGAHSSDTLLVRLIMKESAQVTLEATADLEGIPWLKTASNPAEVIGQTLKLHLPNGRSWFVSSLGPPTVTLHTGYPHPSPVPLTHNNEEPAPELYTVSWTWRPSDNPLRVEITNENPATALIWTVLSNSDVPCPGWQMLTAGEQSNRIALPFKPTPLQWNWKAYTAATIAACGLGLQGCILLIRVRRMRKTNAITQ